MSAPKWEAPSELYFYDEWLQQNAKGRMLCGNNRYIRADLCTPTDERVKSLEAENARLREVLKEGMVCTKEHGGAARFLRIARAALRDMGVET